MYLGYFCGMSWLTNDSFQFKFLGLLLGYAVSVGEYVLKFRRFVRIHVQDIQDAFETSVATHPTTQGRLVEDLNPQL